MKLNNKIHLLSSALFAVLLLLVSTCIYLVFSHMSIQSETQQTSAEVERIAQGIRSGDETVMLAELLRAYAPLDGMIRIVGEDKQSLAAVTSSSAQTLNNFPASYHTTKLVEIAADDHRRYLAISLPLIWHDGQVVNLQVFESLAHVDDTLRRLRLALIFVTLLAMVPVVLSGRLLSKLIISPIAMMIRTMRSIIQSGQFQQLNMQKKSKDELHEMGQTFNQMIDLLESNFARQEQFVSNASHELRTPLTVIESYASLLKRKGKTYPELFEESVEAIHSEAVRMREMTEQLLLLAKSTDQWEVSREVIELSELVKETVQEFQQAHGREVSFETGAAVEVVTDRNLLKQLLFILLDNARKYSDELIEVEIKAELAEPEIWVKDRGVGIAEQDLPKVFERYYRVDKARSRKTGGTGLGLALAKAIAEAIDAELNLQSQVGLGTIGIIRFKPWSLESESMPNESIDVQGNKTSEKKGGESG